MITELTTPVIAGATLISNIFFIVYVSLYVLHTDIRNWTHTQVSHYVNEIIFIITFVAVAGSLTYSNIVGFPPCDLCWVQRIFMYPQTILAFVGMIRKEKNIIHYLFPLSVLGGLVALYHSFVLWGGKSFIPCTQEGSACAKLYVFEYGYITIPVMALSCFAYLIFVSIVWFRSQKKI
jgi:disulfide bond formation protein DsbB